MKRLAIGFAVVFVLFGAFTTFVPCQYSSYPSVRRMLMVPLEAEGCAGNCGQGEVEACGDCSCRTSQDGNCYLCSCNPVWPGCGTWWMFTCDGLPGKEEGPPI